MTWPNLVDLAIIYAILTPTAVLYWHTTDKLLDEWIGNDETKLRVGFASAVIIVLFQDVLRILPAVVYEYFVKLSCLCFHLGCRAVFGRLAALGWLAAGPAYTVVAVAIAWLMFVRGLRNILRLPMVVKFDTDVVDTYRPVSSINFTAYSN